MSNENTRADPSNLLLGGVAPGGKLSTGLNNTVIGSGVGGALTTGSSNILIGTSSNVDAAAASSSNSINIGKVIVGDQDGATNPTVSVLGHRSIIGVLRSADFNSTADQAITIRALTTGNTGYMPLATKYVITDIWVCNGSSALSTAAGGFYPAASKGGTAIVANTQTYANCTSATTMQQCTLAAIAGTTTYTAATLYFSLTSGKGSAATGDIYIAGFLFN